MTMRKKAGRKSRRKIMSKTAANARKALEAHRSIYRELISMTRLKALGFLILAIVFLSLGLTTYYVSKLESWDTYYKIPTLLKWIYIGLVLLVLITRLYTFVKFRPVWADIRDDLPKESHLTWSDVIRIIPKKPDAEYLKQIARWELFISVAALTLAIIPLVYFSGFTSLIGKVLDSYFPYIGAIIGKIISYIITAIVSGILGNFAYDLLKRLISRRIKEDKPNKALDRSRRSEV